MATCKYGQAWMLDALDGGLAGEERRAWNRHLASCAVCQTDWQLLRNTVVLLRNPWMVTAPPGFSQVVMTRVRPKQVAVSRQRGVTLLVGSILALVAVWLPLLVVAVLALIGLTQHPAWLSPVLPVLDQGVLIGRSLLSAGWIVLRELGEAVIEQPMLMMWATILAALVGGWIYGFTHLNIARQSVQE